MVPITRVRVSIFAGAPRVVAVIVMGNVPSGVVGVVAICKFTEAGLPLVGETVGDD